MHVTNKKFNSKKYFILIVITFLFVVPSLTSQTIFKVGASQMFNYDSFHEQINRAYGLDAAVEFGVSEFWTVNVGLSAHYGSNESGWEELQMAGIKQEDFLIGLETDIRYYWDEKYLGPYIGIGGDIKYLNVKYESPPTPNDPVPTLGDFERSLGITFGIYFLVGKVKLNPNFYIAGDPTDVSEYPLHAKIGLNFIF